MFVKSLCVAIALDLFLGDPRTEWHPVRLLGRGAERLEPLCRRLPLPARLQGVVFLLLVLAGVLLPLGVAAAAARMFPAGWLLEGGMLYFALGGTCLAREVRGVAQRLAEGDLAGARKALSLLVSRDTEPLDERKVVSGALETLSENFGDALCAPLLYGALGGPLGAWLHRTANTLDAMVGYKTPAYREFGWAAARFDDLLNLLPARGAALLVAAASPGVGGSFSRTLRTARAFAPLLSSPNSGWPMAAFAGALGVSLGGPTPYFGQWVDKPFLGEGPPPNRTDLERGFALYWNAYACAALSALFLSVLLG
ncbi:adenosylcobinamide-phosphate synthase CbiB [Aminiphilus sp.]|jgi:adenosylcobinamide-phosphate synthase|uniref:adenosylcobinamide-phosphate synthase CbiB n=1 Tax=Aminiphilus sp. TaxID=1872488 RepID=UPI00260EF881|nr:adenosylcobinamide-phosphate synthase CbiB [Aminiphilus sp.]